MNDRNADWNRAVVEEFRAAGGEVGGRFAGRTLALVHHVGRRSGTPRVTPLSCLPIRDGFAVFASAAGRDRHPEWFHNLVAHPDVEIEVGTATLPVRARVLDGEERRRVWEQQKAADPEFARYEARTSRTIPVVLLEPRVAAP